MEKIIEAVEAYCVGKIDTWTCAYFTKGGSYILASNAATNDDGVTHDLVLILPPSYRNFVPSRVIQLRINVNPDLIIALRKALD